MGRGFNEENSAEIVLSRMNCQDQRFETVISSLIRHLHQAIKEVEPTQAEWMQAIEFLTATGQICDDKRQEFILLSDTLGVSMLVDAINHRKPQGATESTVLGPFHVDHAPLKELGENICLDGKGEPCLVKGKVVDVNGRPIPGARLDVWQTNEEGFYDVQQPDQQPSMNLRGLFEADEKGEFWFRSVKPVSYPIPSDGPVGKMLEKMGRHPWRPAHIHFIISAPGFETVITHLFVDGDPYLDSDAVFGVKESLIKQFEKIDSSQQAQKWNLPNPFWELEHTFTLTETADKA